MTYQNVRDSTEAVLRWEVINVTRNTKKAENKLDFQVEKLGGGNEHQSKIKKVRGQLSGQKLMN